MKKIFLISVFSVASVVCSYGQTYYYQHIETVDANKARTKGSGGKYITFTRNSCYNSDKNGYATSKSPHCSNIANTYSYEGKENGLLVFVFDKYTQCDCLSKQRGQFTGSAYDACIWAINLSFSHFGGGRYEYYYFSSDYERMNEPMSGGQTKVYVKSAAPGERGSGPSEFY